MLSPMERTKRAILGSMKGLTECLKFTVETSEEFSDGWLPTLDFKLRGNSNNIIEYAFYEKPTTSDKCLQSDTALNHNCMIKSLSNEFERRLDKFSSTVVLNERVEALDSFSQKMISSGPTVQAARNIPVNGIKSHLRRVERSREQGTHLHRSAADSAPKRRKKKLLAK